MPSYTMWWELSPTFGHQHTIIAVQRNDAISVHIHESPDNAVVTIRDLTIRFGHLPHVFDEMYTCTGKIVHLARVSPIPANDEQFSALWIQIGHADKTNCKP